MNYKRKTDLQLFSFYAELIEELRRRKLVRTGNNPTADYAEYLVSQKLKLHLAPNSFKSYDATSSRGTKYQIKSRRVTKYNNSRQLGVIRNLKTADFNYLIAIIFNETFSCLEAYQIPKKLISKYARYSKHQNGHILILRGPILKDRQAKNITKLFI